MFKGLVVATLGVVHELLKSTFMCYGHENEEKKRTTLLVQKTKPIKRDTTTNKFKRAKRNFIKTKEPIC